MSSHIKSFIVDSYIDIVNEVIILVKNKEIGSILREYRVKNNYTQEDVSEVTGLAPRYISQLERGLSNGSIDTLIKLCNAYNITPNHILAGLLDKPENCYSYNSIVNYNKLNEKNRFVIDSLIQILLENQ